MPRKKVVEYVIQEIRLSDDVTVTASWPKGFRPVIQWNGDTVMISLRDGAANRAMLVPVDPFEAQEPASIAALRARLPNDPTSGGIRKVSKETKPFTSEDAFREAGLDLEVGELSGEGLAALADAHKVASGGSN